MNRRPLFATGLARHTGAALAVGLLAGAALLSSAADASAWPQFRGPGATGLADGPAPPVTFDLETGENIRWVADIPGLGLSSPVVWGDTIYVTTAQSTDGKVGELKIGLYGDISAAEDDGVHRWRVMALDRETGEFRWQRTAWVGNPAIKRHLKASHANSTPAVDDERVVAFFGSEGLYAYDHQGKLLWHQDFGVLDSGFFAVKSAQWGFASSPVIYDDKVIIQADVQENSFVAAFDAATGKELWRTARDEVPGWSTPTVVETASGPQVVVNGYKHRGGYDLATGKEVWRHEGGGDIPVPTPFTSGDHIFFSSAHGPSSPIVVVENTAKGDLNAAGENQAAAKGIVWSEDPAGSYLPTPIVVGDHLFVVRGNAIATSYNKATGKEVAKQRLAERGGLSITGSPVAAGDRIYVAAEGGEVVVMKADGEMEILGGGDVGGEVLTTPAIADGVLYVRTRRQLVAIGETPPKATKAPQAAAQAGE